MAERQRMGGRSQILFVISGVKVVKECSISVLMQEASAFAGGAASGFVFWFQALEIPLPLDTR